MLTKELENTVVVYTRGISRKNLDTAFCAQKIIYNGNMKLVM